jgi:hypothetical protein
MINRHYQLNFLAIAYAEAGDKDKAHKELLHIAELAQTGHPKAFEYTCN